MADLSVTAASVVGVSSIRTEKVTAGTTITAGQAIYKDAGDDNKAKLTDADASDAASVCDGIATHAALDEQPLVIQTQGVINVGATLTVGEVYMASGTAGKIAPHGDFTTGDRATIIGIAETAANLRLHLRSSKTTRA